VSRSESDASACIPVKSKLQDRITGLILLLPQEALRQFVESTVRPN
jgi:hypothetical protein